MPEKRPSGATRRPPVPAKDHDIIDEWMQEVMPQVQPFVERIDQLIRDVHDDLDYAIKWQKAYYGLPTLGWVLEVAAYHKTVNIVFHGGVDFDTPPPLGSTGRTRYVKLHSLEEIDEPEVRHWIEAAGTVPGWV